jgi:polyisoprenoid-binding protein YceI
MKAFFLIILFVFICFTAFTQNKYYTRNGHISFFSAALLENIEAHNRQASCVVDFSTGETVFQVLMRSFEFRKALMQEHFNENYVESAKYPKGSFKGKIQNPESINLKQEGKYNVKISGDMTIHGITKSLSTAGTVEVKAGKVRLRAVFKLKPEDYKIRIPSVVRQNIAETVEIEVNALCERMSSGK